MAVGKLTAFAPTRAAGKRFALVGETLTGRNISTGAPAVGAWGWLTPQALADLLANDQSVKRYVRCGTYAGVPAREKCAVVTIEEQLQTARHAGIRSLLNLPETATVVASSLKFLSWNPGGQWVLFDYDAKYRPGAPLDAAGLVAMLEETIPGLGNAPIVLHSSSSTHIIDTRTGATLIGAGGLHCWVLIDEGTLARDFIHSCHDLLVAAGAGWCVVSEAGEPLIKSAVDVAMAGAVQPAYIGGAIVTAPLAQRRPAPWVIRPDAEALDAAAVIRASRVQAQQFTLQCKALVSADGVMARIEVVLAERRARGAPTPRALGRGRVKGAGVRALPMFDFSVAADAVHLDAGAWGGAGWRTVAELLADRDRYDGATCADLLEPGYGAHAAGQLARNKAKLYLTRGDPVAISQAHGGRIYRLQSPDSMLEGIEVEVVHEMPAKGAVGALEAPAEVRRGIGGALSLEASGDPLSAYPQIGLPEAMRDWDLDELKRRAVLGTQVEEIIGHMAAGAATEAVQAYVESDERAAALGRMAMDAGLRVRVIRGRRGVHWLHQTALCKKPRTVKTLVDELGEVTVARMVCRSKGGGICPDVAWCNRSGYRSQFIQAFGGSVEQDLARAPAQLVISTIAGMTAPSPGDIETARPAIVVVEASAGLTALRTGSGWTWASDEVARLPGAAAMIEWIQAGADPAAVPMDAVAALKALVGDSLAEGEVTPPQLDGPGHSVARALLGGNKEQVRADVLARELLMATQPEASPAVRSTEGVIELRMRPPLERLRGTVLVLAAGYPPADDAVAKIAAPDKPTSDWSVASSLPPLHVTQATDAALTTRKAIDAARRLGGLVAAMAVAAAGEPVSVLADTRVAAAIRADIASERLPQGVLQACGAVQWVAPGYGVPQTPRRGGWLLVIGSWETSIGQLESESGAPGASSDQYVEARRIHHAPDGQRFSVTRMVRDLAADAAATYRHQHAIAAAAGATRARVVVLIEGRPFDNRLAVGGRWDPVDMDDLVPPRGATAYDLAVAIDATGGLDQVANDQRTVDALTATGNWDVVKRVNVWRDAARLEERAKLLAFAVRVERP